MRWHQKDIQGVIEDLKSSLQGLSSEDAVRRLDEYGFNELKEKKTIYRRRGNQFSEESILSLPWNVLSETMYFT